MPKLDELTFEAPGPGSWEIENVHFPRPMTQVAIENFSQPFFEGFREGAARYGSMVDGPKNVAVNRFPYAQMLPAGRDSNAGGLPPKFVFKALQLLHPEFSCRKRNAAQSMADRLWLEDSREWEQVAKPANIARHLELLEQQPAEMSNAQLTDHVR